MKKLYLIFPITVALLLPVLTQAQAFDFISKIACAKTGDCKLNEIVAGFAVLINYGASISGALALLMFIVGGFYMIASAGRPDWVKRGKSILVSTTIAVFFILGSWLIVNSILKALVTDPNFQLENGQPSSDNTGFLTGDAEICKRPGSNGIECGNNQVCYNEEDFVGCVSKCAYQYGLAKSSQFTHANFDCNLPSVCLPVDTTCAQSTVNCRSGSNLCPTSAPNTAQTICCYPL